MRRCFSTVAVGSSLRGSVPAVARRDDPGTKPETKLARARMAAKLSQAELVGAAGISRSGYWRLERGRIANPPVKDDRVYSFAGRELGGPK